MICTLNSLSGWKGLKKFRPRDSFNASLIYILFSMTVHYAYGKSDPVDIVVIEKTDYFGCLYILVLAGFNLKFESLWLV